MKRKVFILLLAISMAFYGNFYVTNFVEASESKLSYDSEEDIRAEINKEVPTLDLVGFDVIETEKDYEIITKSSDDLSRLRLDDNSIGLVVSEEKVKSQLANNKKSLNSYLDGGKTVFFVGDEVTNQELADHFNYDIYLEEEVSHEDGTYDYARYVTQDENGKLSFGVIVVANDVSVERANEAIINEAWLRKDKKNRRGGYEDDNFRNISNYDLLKTSVASASNGVFRSYGGHWYNTWGPLNYTFTTNYGHLYEVKRGYSLDPRFDQDPVFDYTILSMYWETVPDKKLNQAGVKQAKFFSNAELVKDTQPGVNVEQYGPRSVPSSSTVTYQVGLSGTDLHFNGSWNVVRNDLTIRNLSDLSRRYVELVWNFNSRSQYARDTTVQEPAISYRAWQGSQIKHIQMSNTRNVTFEAYIQEYPGISHDFILKSDTKVSPSYTTNVPIYGK